MGSADLPEFAARFLTASRCNFSPALLADGQNFTASHYILRLQIVSPGPRDAFNDSVRGND
jgi:hypothetical protein